MIPELNVLGNIEEIKTIWNETVTNLHQCIDYVLKSMKKGRILSAASMGKNKKCRSLSFCNVAKGAKLELAIYVFNMLHI